MRKEIIDLDSSLSDLKCLLNQDEWDILRENAVIQHYRKHQQIYCEGDEPTDVMCLLQGQVKIYKDGIGGRCQIIRMIRPVQYFAYRAYFAGEKYLTAASAFEASTVCAIPVEVMDSLLKQNNELAMYFIRQLSIDLGIADYRTVNLTQKHVRGRLADSLVFLMDSYGLEEDNTINIYLAREDLASLSNMTSSNAIRTLSHFVNEHVIGLDGRKIKVIDEERLRKISRLG